MDLSALENVERIPYTVIAPDGRELGTGVLSVDITRITQGFMFAVSTFAPDPDLTDDENGRALAELTLSPIVGWDLTRAGDPLPVDVDTYLTLPTIVIAALGEALGATTNPKAKKGARSAAG